MTLNKVFKRSFYKYEAAGNDFILFPINKMPVVGLGLRKNISEICDRNRGVGGDGLIFVAVQNKVASWKYFNKDGSETKLCGNATRCVAHHLFQKNKKAKKILWKGDLGTFEAKPLSKERFSVTWSHADFKNVSRKVPEDLMELLLGFNDHGLAGVFLLHVGVPHLVLVNHEVWNPEQRIGNSAQLRSFPSLGPEGANVTWVSLKTKDAVTYERGVEAETLACGSGALAAFYAVQEYRRENLSNPSDPLPCGEDFHFPGGLLSVKKEKDTSLWLAGAVRKVFEGKFV